MTNRDEYVEQLKASLDKMNAQIDELEAKVRKHDAAAREQYAKRLVEIQNKRDDARKSLVALQDAGGEAWDRLQKGAEQVWSDLKQTVDEAQDAFARGLDD